MGKRNTRATAYDRGKTEYEPRVPKGMPTGGQWTSTGNPAVLKPRGKRSGAAGGKSLRGHVKAKTTGTSNTSSGTRPGHGPASRPLGGPRTATQNRQNAAVLRKLGYKYGAF